MTTLPPEGESPQQDGAPHQDGVPQYDGVPQSDGVPQTDDAAQPGAAYPGNAEANRPPYSNGAPQQPAYAPPPNYGAPKQPGAPGGYAGQPGYAAPHATAADPLSNLQLNYWLSVFFLWIPALIFYIIEKDKPNPQVRALHAANLNFSLLRTALAAVGWIFAFLPIIGPLLLIVAHIVLFVFHILAATKVTETYQRGGGDPFIFNVPLVK